MNLSVKKSLEQLHSKQDEQTEKLIGVELTITKQQLAMDSYMKQSDRMASELQKMNENMVTYNSELKVHIAGVIELKEQNRLMREEIKQRDSMINSRLEIAEKPIQWAQTTGKIFKWVGIVATSITAIAGVIALIVKLAGGLK